MTDSRVRRWAFAALVAPLAFAIPAGAQWSSDKPPVLQPDDYPPIADEPSQDTPSPNHGQPSPGPSDVATEPPQSLTTPPVQQGPVLPAVGPSVEVGSLGTAEGPPVGTLDSSNGGLGENMWSGSERGAAEDLLERAPLANADPVLRALTRRVVLTRAAAPAGAAKQAFVTVRLRKLLDAGLLDDAGTIAAQATVTNDEAFARAQADALLYDNRTADVCGNATATRLSAGEPFWLELRTYCAAAGGDQATADLTKSVLQAQGNDDAAFETLLDDAVNHKTVVPSAIADPTALHVFLMQQAGLAIPEDVVAKLGTPAAMVAIRDPQNSAQSRFIAAERTIRTGAISLAQLKVIADAQDLPLSRVSNAANDAPNMPFFTSQVLLRRAAVIEPRPGAKIELAYQALSLGRKAGLLPLAAALQSDVLVSLKPSGDREKVRLIARGLLLAHHPDAAARWVTDQDVLQTVAAFTANDPAKAPRLQAAYAVYADGLAKNPPDPDPDGAYKGLVLGLADVLGQQMPPNGKLQASAVEAKRWDGKRPDPGLMQDLERAASQPERRGEALLMIVNTVQELGLRELAPDVTIEFVRQIGNMGLPQSARLLAVDALAQYVPPPLPPSPTAAAR
jgi:hypothetical protein